MEIRRADPGDPIPWTLLLDADGPKAEVRKYLARGELWLAQEGPRVLGSMILMETRAGLWEIMNLAVRADSQRRGIGTLLLGKARSLARRRGARRLEVGTGNSSIGPLAFYQRFGFRIVGVEVDFFARRWKRVRSESGIALRDMVRLEIDFERRARAAQAAGGAHSSKANTAPLSGR
jgi:ribosomal protein S18 acetylase RimI-like enzyme